MTLPIDDLLARARLVEESYSQADIDAGADRVLARVAARRQEHAEEQSENSTDGGAAGSSCAAAERLRNLCELVVAHTSALSDLRMFLARCLPEPSGARVLGCILQLTGREDPARFWWQYAAGAGDSAATYCLYLHHLALGESSEARWWHDQSDGHLAAATMDAGRGEAAGSQSTKAEERPDRYEVWRLPHVIPPVALHAPKSGRDVATALRVLTTLKRRSGAATEWVNAVMAYVPAAVRFVDDDLDLPLPEPDFVDCIGRLTSAQVSGRPAKRRVSPLPTRKSGSSRERSPLIAARLSGDHEPIG